MKDAAAQNMDMNAEIWRGCLSVIFAPNAVNVARYASLIWHIIPFGYKSPTKWEIHLPESIVQTRSKVWRRRFLRCHTAGRTGKQNMYQAFITKDVRYVLEGGHEPVWTGGFLELYSG